MIMVTLSTVSAPRKCARMVSCLRCQVARVAGPSVSPAHCPTSISWSSAGWRLHTEYCSGVFHLQYVCSTHIVDNIYTISTLYLHYIKMLKISYSPTLACFA